MFVDVKMNVASGAHWGGSSPAYPNGFPWMDPRKALSDKYTVIAMEREIAELAPDIEVLKDWRGPEFFSGD